MRKAALVLLSMMALILLPAVRADAHAILVSADPPAGAVIPDTQPPREVTLTFSESVQPVRVSIIGPKGERAERGEVQSQGDRVIMGIREGAGNGTYVVSYRVVSADSHPISGGYSFSIGEASAAPTSVGLGGAAEVDPVVTALMPIARYIGYAGLALIVGPVLFASMLWPRRLPLPGPLVWSGVGLVAVSTVAGLYLQAPYTTGSSLFGVTGSDMRDVLSHGRYGFAGQVRLAILVASIPFLRRVLTRTAEHSDWIILGILGAGAAFTWSFAGHPGASLAPFLTIGTDMVHLMAMAVWIGGLIVLFGYLLPKGNDPELQAVLPVWSRWALWSVAVLGLTGVAQALVQIASPSELFSTRYGQILLVKVGVFALVIVAAYFIRRRMQGGAVNIRRAVAGELAGLAVVLAATAILVQTTPARTAAAIEGTLSIPYSQTVQSDLYRLQVDIDPAAVGNNTMHLYASTVDGKPAKVLEWSATAALPDKGIEAVSIPLLPLSPDHASGEVTFPVAGDWQLRFTLRLSEVDQATVTQIVRIR